jgi:hypothetical protein
MRHRFVGSWLAAVLGLSILVALTSARVAGQAPAGRAEVARASTYTAPRLPFGQPNIQGVWNVRNLARYDIQDHSASPGVPAGKGVVEGNELPYQPWALEKKKENFKNSRSLNPMWPDPLKSADPLAKCYMPGVPRATYLGWPFQIYQTPKYIAILYEWTHVWRLIYLDRPDHLENIGSYQGFSLGKWEGNTLVVEVKDFNDFTWFDMAGNFHSDALHVTERYTPVDADTLQYEATITDPKVFTRPWKMSMPLHRQTEIGILDYECYMLVDESGIPLTWPREEKER